MPQLEDLFVLQRPSTSTHHKLSWENLLTDVNSSSSSEKGVHVGETAPPDPHEGDLWFKPNSDAANDGVLYLYYVTPTTGVVSSLSIRGSGSGYKVKDNVAVVGGDGHELLVNITSVGSSGSITGFEIADGGHGYETGNVGFLFNDGHANASVIVTNVSSVPDGEWIVLVDNRRSRVPTMGSPPSNPRNGELYWDINNANMYIYYDDGITAQWVPAFTPFSGNVVVNDVDGGQYDPETPGSIDPTLLDGSIYEPDFLDPNAETINGGAF